MRIVECPEFPGYGVDEGGGVWCRRPANGRGSDVAWRRKLPTMKGGKAKHTPGKRLEVCLMKDGQRVYRKVAYLVLTTFVGPRPSGLQVCHKDDDPTNNARSNLYWGTPKRNMKDRDRNGGTSRGEVHHFARLTEKEAREILALQHKAKPADVCKRYAVSYYTVRAIWMRKTWKHL